MTGIDAYALAADIRAGRQTAVRDRQPGVRPDPQPARPRPYAGRLERWRRGVGGGRVDPPGPGYRRRRLDPHPGLLLRRDRPKPTFGLVPKEPGFKGWKSLWVDGPLATSVRDAALMLSVIAGPSAADDTPVAGPVGDLRVRPGGDLHGLRVAYSADLGHLPVDPEVRRVFAAALEIVAALGATLTPAAPRTGDPTVLWNTIALAEGLSSEGPLLARGRSRARRCRTLRPLPIRGSGLWCVDTGGWRRGPGCWCWPWC